MYVSPYKGYNVRYFVGTYENKVDAKGRVSLPSAFRDVLTMGGGGNFYVFPSPTVHALEAGGEDLIAFIADSMEENAPMFSEQERTMSFIMANARPVSYDKTGRFVLPEELAKFGNIDDKAIFVGNGKRFQIWQPSAHAHAFANHRESFAKQGISIQKPTGRRG